MNHKKGNKMTEKLDLGTHFMELLTLKIKNGGFRRAPKIRDKSDNTYPPQTSKLARRAIRARG